ncbi:MAG: GxxExxY protein [Chitinophagales bacterium]|jgi:GxxExxY protein|nr:GxxExxY protein [Bacteroidota bacterium]MBK9505392.1 GxxExxY protein [Bacteroidota bacterium]MBK9556488.1 GxxExxY protein [Bacteroidota bacterium]MBL0278826.1 GxxExxY protein [Bacteroidota bacterium]MBP8250085.1 GxxExxY protein [Chitinophagales bacterium]
MNKYELNEREQFLAKKIVEAAILVHRVLGPGLLEKVYEICIAHVLMKQGIKVVRQTIVPVKFMDLEIKNALRLDLLVDDCIIVEVKAAETVHPIWQAQILSQLKLTGNNIGFLLNFNVTLMKDGIRRFSFNHNK